MVRFLLFAFLFYILFMIVSSVFNAFFKRRDRGPSATSSGQDESMPPKRKVEYTNVEDAKFKDMPETKPPDPSNQN